MLAHARETGAEECCGAVVTSDAGERVIRFTNVQNELHAREPDTYTRTAESAYTPRAEAYELLDAGGTRSASSSRSSTIRIRRAARTSLRRTGREPCSATSRRIPT